MRQKIVKYITRFNQWSAAFSVFDSFISVYLPCPDGSRNQFAWLGWE